jgi:hypothetical protein
MARQSYRLRMLRAQMSLSTRGRLTALPPILTFQSVMDFTVAPAVLSGLYDHIPRTEADSSC